MAEKLSCLRRDRHTGNAAEVRWRDFRGKRFNSEIISSMIESLIYGSSIVSVTGSICRENKYDEFRG